MVSATKLCFERISSRLRRGSVRISLVSAGTQTLLALILQGDQNRGHVRQVGNGERRLQRLFSHAFRVSRMWVRAHA